MSHGEMSVKYRIMSTATSVITQEIWLSEETHDKITSKHSNVPLDQVIKTLQKPDTICSGNRPNTLVFLNSSEPDRHGSPLRVPIKTYLDKPAIVKTAFYGSSKNYGQVVWRNPELGDDQ